MPPSAPSTVIQSGVMPVSSIALHMASTSARPPTHSLSPTVLPPASSRTRATNCIISTGVENSECPSGRTHSCPCGAPLASAIFLETLEAGSTPPTPGLAPWLSLIRMPLTSVLVAFSANMSGLNAPSTVRQPKYPEPNSQMMSAPYSRW